MSRKIEAEIVNMIMIYDKDNQKAVVLNRIKSWPGITFPGGHVEYGESFTLAAIREAYEETGLVIDKIIPCGVVNWADKHTGKRYIEFLYKSCDFHGKIKTSTEEGDICWMNYTDIKNSGSLSPNFELYFPMFFENKYQELFFEWDGKSWTATPKYI